MESGVRVTFVRLPGIERETAYHGARACLQSQGNFVGATPLREACCIDRGRDRMAYEFLGLSEGKPRQDRLHRRSRRIVMNPMSTSQRPLAHLTERKTLTVR